MIKIVEQSSDRKGYRTLRKLKTNQNKFLIGAFGFKENDINNKKLLKIVLRCNFENDPKFIYGFEILNALTNEVEFITYYNEKPAQFREFSPRGLEDFFKENKIPWVFDKIIKFSKESNVTIKDFWIELIDLSDGRKVGVKKKNYFGFVETTVRLSVLVSEKNVIKEIVLPKTKYKERFNIRCSCWEKEVGELEFNKENIWKILKEFTKNLLLPNKPGGKYELNDKVEFINKKKTTFRKKITKEL